MIQTDSLTRRYGARTAVDGLSFHVPKGEIVGFLGPNGAGKTTTLRMLAGFLPPSSGTARIGGRDVVTESLEARRLLGYMPETVPLYPEMRVREYLTFRAEIKGVRGKALAPAVDRALGLADLGDVAGRLVGELSKGYRQRVGLADALVASPPLLILDEPSEGLDPNQILRVREVVKSLGKEHTILLSTHILPEVEAVCSRVVIIHQGKIVAEGPIETVRAQLEGASVEATVLLRADEDAVRRVLGAVEGLTVRETRAAGEGLVRATIEVPGKGAAAGVVLEGLVARRVREGLGVREVSPQARSLEDVFHAITTREADAEAAPKEA